MGLTMNKILSKFDDCNKFSLTGKTMRYNITISQEEFKRATEKLTPEESEKYLEQFIENYNITEEEFTNALLKLEEKSKEEKRKIYENSREKFINYPEFDELYEEIKQECYDFDNEENKQFYINKCYNEKHVELLKNMGITEERINKMKEDFFRCAIIGDTVGKTTKYGNEHRNYFYHLYRDIASIIDGKKNRKNYCVTEGKSPLERIPAELKEHFLYYEVSYNNAVTISSGLMINYYFELNEETKKYLLQFRNDFCMRDLEDLTLYKEDEIKFYSCTHERFNSIEFDYKEMSNEEIIDFINDEFFEEDNSKIIEIINELIKMEINTKFTFKELNIQDEILMKKICSICDGIKLQLISKYKEEQNLKEINENGDLQSVREIPAALCNIDDIIEKKS